MCADDRGGNSIPIFPYNARKRAATSSRADDVLDVILCVVSWQPTNTFHFCFSRWMSIVRFDKKGNFQFYSLLAALNAMMKAFKDHIFLAARYGGEKFAGVKCVFFIRQHTRHALLIDFIHNIYATLVLCSLFRISFCFKGSLMQVELLSATLSQSWRVVRELLSLIQHWQNGAKVSSLRSTAQFCTSWRTRGVYALSCNAGVMICSEDWSETRPGSC